MHDLPEGDVAAVSTFEMAVKQSIGKSVPVSLNPMNSFIAALASSDVD